MSWRSVAVIKNERLRVIGSFVRWCWLAIAISGSSHVERINRGVEI